MMHKMNWKMTLAAAALLTTAAAFVYFVALPTSVSNAAEPKMKAVMYKPLQCGCCDAYAEYLERHGFEVEVESLRSLTKIKRMSGVPEGLEGCHTLLVDGYTVDGLVPVQTLRKLLTERPAIKGISLPGMPWGAPGMEQRPKEGPLTIYELSEGSAAPKVYAQE